MLQMLVLCWILCNYHLGCCLRGIKLKVVLCKVILTCWILPSLVTISFPINYFANFLSDFRSPISYNILKIHVQFLVILAVGSVPRSVLVSGCWFELCKTNFAFILMSCAFT